MMDRQSPPQPSLFYRFSLEQRVPIDNPLRVIAGLVDFDFVYDEVEAFYGAVGKPSIPPPVIVKLMFLLAFENVRSERALFAALPLRLDWLWFLGMDLDSEIPNHSVLSKARARWGAGVFRNFFERVIAQAMTAGLIDGTRLFCDGSLFDANASKRSVVTVGVVDLSTVSDELERRLDDDADETIEASAPVPPVKVERRSTTDPDAAVVTKPGAGSPRPRYKAHRAVDDHAGIITATDVTAGDRDEGQQLESLLDQHERNTTIAVDVVIGDTQYGTMENYLLCLDRGVTPRMRLLAEKNEKRQKEAGLFARTDFRYDDECDAYHCPAGQRLRRSQLRADRDAIRYLASPDACQPCPLRERCTSGAARSITRHVRQAEIDLALADLKTPRARRDLRRRKHFMERSFAVAVRFGLKRCRWRGLPSAEMHELLIATAQNIEILMRHQIRNGRAALAARVVRPLLAAVRGCGAVLLHPPIEIRPPLRAPN